MKRIFLYMILMGSGLFTRSAPSSVNPLTNHRNMNIDSGRTFFAKIAISKDSVFLVSAALPQRETWIPDEVIKNLNRKFGPDLYDITLIKCSNGEDGNVIRVIKNGNVKTTLVNADGAPGKSSFL